MMGAMRFLRRILDLVDDLSKQNAEEYVPVKNNATASHSSQALLYFS
jgi:hypothetical protein